MQIGMERGATRSDVTLIKPDNCVNLETPASDVRAFVHSTLLNTESAPDGILCGGELPAIAAMAGIRDAGLVPGKDVDVFAKQTSAALDHIHPAIDSCYEDINRTGRLLGQTLLAVINADETAKEHTHIIEPELRIRT